MKTVLITGTNRGIGLEFVRQYADDGWRVLACTRNPSTSSELNQLAAQFPDVIHIHALDVTNHEQIAQLSHELSTDKIDLLINNAGVYPTVRGATFHQVDYDAWGHAFKVNSMAPLKMADAFFSQISRSELKKIVSITSKMGSVADNRGGGSYVYRSSKSALNIVMKSLALDLESKGFIVALLHPGWVRTDMGGPNGLISAEKSVSGMRHVIDGLTHTDTGKFFAFDGQIVPW
ncbi:NAD(P)-dependent dehydrogenase, short-chain alcohol dehydrogenase family [Nitrosomonas aestuarii]|uniref:NAD(P)-dependent dehydrogenase, short-chain alcohol dehydrogenase family n=1 Tax=Nitrosomonas aestuarii TaxID=52441 RepID=A0A1I4AI62_9PROT|nr:SDR family oxidoreductase [Nitrosomonas aestuarii]SFK56162.1 NAD(P)-dependent dehydrogenase, short-chain alcohol dehydrogenase family [Nitrosomonas aestuarii]